MCVLAIRSYYFLLVCMQLTLKHISKEWLGHPFPGFDLALWQRTKGRYEHGRHQAEIGYMGYDRRQFHSSLGVRVGEVL